MKIKQIRSKQAYILNNNIGVSYNTPIAANVDGVTFITENYYSNTTAHHKTDIKREFNNSQVIEVNQETIKDFYYFLTYGEYTSAQNLAAAVQEEAAIKQDLITYVKEYNGNPKKAAWKNLKVNAYKLHNDDTFKLIIDESTTYKNGNVLNVRKYRTNFNYVSNLTFKISHRTRKIKATAKAAITTGTAPATPETKIITLSYKGVIYS